MRSGGKRFRLQDAQAAIALGGLLTSCYGVWLISAAYALIIFGGVVFVLFLAALIMDNSDAG